MDLFPDTTAHQGEMHGHSRLHPASVVVDACYVLSARSLREVRPEQDVG